MNTGTAASTKPIQLQTLPKDRPGKRMLKKKKK